jgi:DNA-binding MarR family transcriptional regulator
LRRLPIFQNSTVKVFANPWCASHSDHACHVDHVKASSSAVHLSARDSAILAHFQDSRLLQPSKLARHLGIARSTMSQALKKLVALGYVGVQKNPSDRRISGLSLTDQGRKAMQAASVLDYAKVKALLRQLSPAQRSAALDGLDLLARAAAKAMLKAGTAHRPYHQTKKVTYEMGSHHPRNTPRVDRHDGPHRGRLAEGARREPLG